MTYRWRQATTSGIVVAALALAASVAAHRMPGSLSTDGWLVALCPEGLPSTFLGDHGHHHHDSAAVEATSASQSACPLAAMLEVPAEPPAVHLLVSAGYRQIDRVEWVPATPPVRFRPAYATRAPPVS